MSVIFFPEAQAELDEASARYEEQREGLGEEFAREVQATIQRIVDYPQAWPRVSRTARCCVTDRFPYGLVYLRRDAAIHIVAVMHLSRKPGYWKHRLHG